MPRISISLMMKGSFRPERLSVTNNFRLQLALRREPSMEQIVIQATRLTAITDNTRKCNKYIISKI